MKLGNRDHFSNTRRKGRSTKGKYENRTYFELTTNQSTDVLLFSASTIAEAETVEVVIAVSTNRLVIKLRNILLISSNEPEPAECEPWI